MKTRANAVAVSLLLFGWTGLLQAQFAHTISIANEDGTISTVPMVIAPGERDQTHLFRDPSVIRDLELVDEQTETINKLLILHRELIQKRYEEFHKAKAQGDPDRIKEIKATLATLQKIHQKELSEVLLPHQRDRLKQVSWQIQLNAIGSAAAFQHGVVGADLNITDAQKTKFAEIGQELQKQIAAKTAELKDEAREKVMAELTAEQKSRFKAMTGEKFKRDQNDWKEYAEKRQAETKKQSKDR